MITNQLNNKKLPLLEFIIVICLFAVYLLPAVSIGSTILLVLLLAYCGYLVIMDKKLFSMVVSLLGLICILAIFYALLTDASSISQFASNRGVKRFISKLYQYLTLYFPAILFVRINQRATVKQKRLLAIIGVLMMLYVIITTWIFLQGNPNATRDWENFGENSEQGVANYYFIYAVPILLSVIAVYMVGAKGVAKLAACCLVVAGILFLVSAQYTLAILIAIIGVLLQIFRTIRSDVVKILFAFAMFVIALFLPQILEFAIITIESDQVTTRLGEIYSFLTGYGADGQNLNGRLTLYWRTIDAFLASPIWGNRSLDFDGHATFLTVLSDTGLLGGIPFYLLLITVCKSIKKQLGKRCPQYDLVITMFVLMGLTNPVHAAMPLGLATWLLAPLLIQIILKEEMVNAKPLEN